ncbi:sodium-coupled monocarboxylate transporter 1-like [Dermacentor variabilis]|uniref:sodium-coupled monocarboxylate transporter 1-like n=1 Tax=Dermacentor variabilis TaxID=34621 RepID=UPI003F5C442F
MSPPKSLGAADCAVFGVLTALGYLVGLYFSIVHRRRQVAAADGSGSAATEVFLGGRSLPEAALTVSVLASIVNGVTVVGFLGHFYAHGFHMMWVLTGIPLAMIVTSTTLVPLLYDMRAASIFQFLRLRFDNKVGITACVVYFVLSQTLGAVGIYSAAIGISTMFSFPLLYSNIVIGLAGTIYTALGGLRSVVWADCVQALVMLASPAIIIGKVMYDSGSASPPLRSMSDLNVTQYILRTNMDLTSDENVWSALAGALPYSLVRTGFDQMAVQRFIAARTLREAKRIVITGALFVLSFFALAAVGALAIVYWYRDCDPVLAGLIKSFDQIVPYYMRERLTDVAVLRGLFLAGLLGASTSTVSSIVNSHAATFYIDIVSPYVSMSDRTAANVMRLLALASGTIMTLFAIAVPFLGTATRLFVSLYSSASGPFSGLILLAISSPWVNAKGAAWASILVCVLQLWHAVGRMLSAIPPPPVIPGTLERCPSRSNDTGMLAGSRILADEPLQYGLYVFPLYRLSFFWITFIGALLTILLGTTLSLVTGGAKQSTANLRFTSPVFLNFWRRFKFFQQALQLDEAEASHNKESTLLSYNNDECTALNEQASQNGKQEIFKEASSRLLESTA